MLAPVMYEASDEARKATTAATSSGCPTRPRAVSAPTRAKDSGDGFRHDSVRMGPGRTALTRTAGPYSTASWRASAQSAPFVAAYAECPATLLSACTLEVNTSDPRQRVRSSTKARTA